MKQVTTSSCFLFIIRGVLGRIIFNEGLWTVKISRVPQIHVLLPRYIPDRDEFVPITVNNINKSLRTTVIIIIIAFALMFIN